MFSTNNEEVDFLERLKKRDREKLKLKQRGHMPVMDRDTLVQLCVDNDGYETPELNDNLFAHFKGFQKIEGLEPFYNLKALWLESNGLLKIENLDCLPHLRCLYLNKNLIERMEHLQHLTNLTTLDLSENCIKTIEGLGGLDQLTSLNMSKNQLEHVHDIEALKNYKSITNLDLSHNHLGDPDVLHVFAAMANLKALRLTGNDVVSKTKSFRKTYITTLPHLGYLDRPIFEMERLAAAAWREGGVEAEEKARRAFIQREHDERRRSLEEFRQWQNEIREKKLRELQLRREAGQDVPSYFDLHMTTEAERTRAEEARREFQEEKQSVQGDGIKVLGEVFWAQEDARRLDATTLLEQQPQEESGNVPSLVTDDGIVDSSVDPRGDESVTSATRTNDLVPDEVDPATSIDELSHGDDDPTTAEATRIHDVAASLASVAIDELPQTATATFELPPAGPRGFSAPPPPPASTERETWESLTRRAETAPYLHKPMALPSAYATHDEPGASDDSDDDDESIIKPLTRSAIWDSITAAASTTDLTALD
ncbi:Aste57867_8908 [Aphanomyces stellatus]|uniref:Aste57867_8908 protein n=1 Tax=Aphanomyces stellatus TaxID=120398 RepID=A0A485KLL8_9STRA|nr:hypothetical protein As57867_008873 [Aphanomyces stellatus]VFT85792.1 Aste57867_8908 [Aphanomyces stellatus]